MRRVDAVLNVNGGQVGIAGEVEGDGDAAGSIVAAGGGDVLHALGAVDLLLQRNGDRAFYRLCAGTGVETGDADLRGSQIWKLRDGQRGNYGSTRQNYQQGAHRGEHRASNKKLNEHRSGVGLQRNMLQSANRKWQLAIRS